MASGELTQVMAEALTVLTHFPVPLYLEDDYGRPSLHGTGFFVKSGDAHFLVTAAHVLDTAHERGLFFYVEPGRIRTVTGLSTRSGRSAAGRATDIVDIGVVRLTEDSVPPYPRVEKYAMELEYLHPEYLPRGSRGYGILGFPATKSKLSRAEATVLAAPHAYLCQPIPDGDYPSLGFEPKTHLLLHLNLKVGYGLDGGHQHFPKPQGMSGAPVFVLYSDGPEDNARVFPVVAVGIEYRPREKLLIATDVRYVLEAIGNAA
jgi:hypothetical protein